jgi:hypothetical protein
MRFERCFAQTKHLQSARVLYFNWLSSSAPLAYGYFPSVLFISDAY